MYVIQFVTVPLIKCFFPKDFSTVFFSSNWRNDFRSFQNLNNKLGHFVLNNGRLQVVMVTRRHQHTRNNRLCRVRGAGKDAESRLCNPQSHSVQISTK